MSINEIKKELKMLLKKAKMNNNLKKAIEETIKALNKNDIELAYELSAVKSFVSGEMNSTHNFTEDADYNYAIFGKRDVYSILDYIHHELAYMADKMPSGMMAFTSGGGMYEKGMSEKKHPIIKIMEKERAKIYKDVWK